MDGQKLTDLNFSSNSKTGSLDNKLKLIANSIGEEKVKFDENISYHTALGLGGIVKMFTVASNEREMIRLVEYCQHLDVPFLVIGTGSKAIVSDQGFDGVIIKNRTSAIKIISIKGQVSKVGIGVESVKIEVEGGVILKKLVEFLQKQGLEYQEFEDLTGSIGGNIFVNRSLQDLCEQVRVLNLDSDTEIIAPSELNLRRHIVLSVVLKIKAK